MANSRGVGVLAHLVANPGRHLRAPELLPFIEKSNPLGAGHNGLGKGRSKGEYRRRFDLLRTELRRAMGRNDSAAVRKVERELQSVTRELAHAIGLAHDGSCAAADQVVADAITAAIAAIARRDRAVADYLHRTVHAGRTFSYTPDEG